MSDSLLDAVSVMVEQSGKPIKAIAEEVGKPYTTLKRELNEFDDLAKLGAELIYPLMVACNGDQPLFYLADRRGYTLSKQNARDVQPLEPAGVLAAFAKLMQLEANPDATRMEMLELVNTIICEAEAIMNRKFPQQRVAFSRGVLEEIQEENAWERVKKFFWRGE